MIFIDDPGYYHERIVGAEVFPGSYLIATSGGHEYVEESKHWAKVWLMLGADGYPAGLEGEMMAFDDVWDDPKMLILVKRMRELVLSVRSRKLSHRKMIRKHQHLKSQLRSQGLVMRAKT